jgi:hypothetical protein
MSCMPTVTVVASLEIDTEVVFLGQPGPEVCTSVILTLLPGGGVLQERSSQGASVLLVCVPRGAATVRTGRSTESKKVFDLIASSCLEVK